MDQPRFDGWELTDDLLEGIAGGTTLRPTIEEMLNEGLANAKAKGIPLEAIVAEISQWRTNEQLKEEFIAYIKAHY